MKKHMYLQMKISDKSNLLLIEDILMLNGFEPSWLLTDKRPKLKLYIDHFLSKLKNRYIYVALDAKVYTIAGGPMTLYNFVCEIKSEKQLIEYFYGAKK